MPTGEAARLAALRSYRILDTDPEEAFDDLTLCVAHLRHAHRADPLIDEDRQWFKSRVGISIAETELSISFCAHAIQEPESSSSPTPPATSASVRIRWCWATRTSGSTPRRRWSRRRASHRHAVRRIGCLGR